MLQADPVTVVFVLGKYPPFLSFIPKLDNMSWQLHSLLGGPGCGKGTQCDLIKQEYGFVHLSGKGVAHASTMPLTHSFWRVSAGDLLRAEQSREGSEYSELIQTYIREGKIVPMEVTIALLDKAIKEARDNDGKTRFLVDGFPRKMDQALKFEEVVVESKFTLYFECSEETLLNRLLKRGESSGRVDDNIESIKKRFQTFKETSYPVIEYYEQKGKAFKVTYRSMMHGCAWTREWSSIFTYIMPLNH